jgi:hypothetical protein
MSQHQPPITELLRAARDALRVCAARLDGQERYLALSAAYALGICERELEHGACNDAAERSELAGLLGRDAPLSELRDALCDRIRSGALDDRWTEILGLLVRQAGRDASVVKPEHVASGDAAPARGGSDGERSNGGA